MRIDDVVFVVEADDRLSASYVSVSKYAVQSDPVPVFLSLAAAAQLSNRLRDVIKESK